MELIDCSVADQTLLLERRKETIFLFLFLFLRNELEDEKKVIK